MDWFLYDIGLRHERVKKHLNQHIIYYNFSFLIQKFLKLVKFITQSYLFTAFEFIFILRHIFRLPKKASTTIFSDGWLTSLFSANKLYYVVFLSFFCIQLFPSSFIVQVFSGSRFFSVQVFQGLGPGFRSSPFKDDPLCLRKYPVNMTGYSLLHL